MHYYKFNIADYRKDTAHLSRLEHGIYRDLIDWYYLDEKPIPLDTQMVSRRLRLGADEVPSLLSVLNDFFIKTPEGYRQNRIEAEIEAFHSKAATNRVNGRNGGRPKKEETGNNPSGCDSEPSRNPNQEPLTTNQEPVKTNKTTLSGKPSGAPSPLPVKSDTQDDTPARVIEYLNDKAKRKFPAKGKNLTLVKARIAEGATFEQLTGVVDLKCHAWLNDPKMHEFIRPATLFGQEKFAQYVGQLGMPRPKTKAEELDEAFGLAPAAGQPETMGDVFEGAWKEVFGDRL